MAYETILLADQDRVRTITLNRPDVLNAITDQLADELIDAIEAADRDDDVNVVLITGAGRGFCSGLDFVERGKRQREPTRYDRLNDLGWVGRQALVITGCSKPVVAAINGPAVGAGLSIALSCDVRVMAAGAKITTGYARRGLNPDGGMSWFLPRLVGQTRAMDLMLTARDVLGEEAERIGLVAAVYPDATFAAEAHAYAARIAANAPIGMTNSKRLLVESLDNPLATQLKRELTLIRQCFASEDFQEGLKAFFERRPAVFRGR